MADNTWQARAMISTHACLEHHFRHRQDVAVCIDLVVYYLDGDGTGSVAPDVFVKFGCEKRDRMTYKVWDEAGPPDFVLEVASPNTVHNDLADKSTIYARMGVREYWMFDPMGSLLDPRLQGFELAGNSYREFSEVNREGVDLAQYSRVLELEFHQRGDRLRIGNPWTGEYLPTLREEARIRKTAELERRAAERRRKEEARLRKAAELERNEEARLRREAERRRNEEVRLRRAAEQKTHELQRVIADLQSKLTPQ